MKSFENWAHQVSLNGSFPIARSDKEIADLASLGERIIKIESGNIFRTLGGRESLKPSLSHKSTVCEIDLGTVQFDDEMFLFASHCSLRQYHFSTKGVLVMNSQFYKNRRVAIRGHPSDGKLDMLRSQLNLRQYMLAAKLSESGSHIPHPDIHIKSSDQHSISFQREMRIFTDGRLIGRSDEVSISLLSKAIKVII